MSVLIRSDRRTSTDRRSGVDRRQRDMGPQTGSRERRNRPEPRKPEVSEIALSDREWALAFGKLPRRNRDEGDGSA